MRKSVFYRLKTFTQGRLPSADVSSLSISYKVVALYSCGPASERPKGPSAGLAISAETRTAQAFRHFFQSFTMSRIGLHVEVHHMVQRDNKAVTLHHACQDCYDVFGYLAGHPSGHRLCQLKDIYKERGEK